MKPSYEELVQLNILLKNKSKQEVDELINTIISKGYVWNQNKKCFYHPGMGMSIRTQGLDVFDRERFLRTFEVWSNPEFSKWATLAHTYIPKLLLLFILLLLFGWIFIPARLWFGLILIVLIFIIHIKRLANKKMHQGRFSEKNLKI